MSSWTPVYAFVKRIPRGRVITYGGLAKAIKLRGGARAAGHAMAASPSGKGVPWHRVVGSGGAIKCPGEAAAEQRFRLRMEGVTFRGARVNMTLHEHKFPKTRRA